MEINKADKGNTEFWVWGWDDVESIFSCGVVREASLGRWYCGELREFQMEGTLLEEIMVNAKVCLEFSEKSNESSNLELSEWEGPSRERVVWRKYKRKRIPQNWNWKGMFRGWGEVGRGKGPEGGRRDRWGYQQWVRKAAS